MNGLTSSFLFDSHQLSAWIFTICAKWDAKTYAKRTCASFEAASHLIDSRVSPLCSHRLRDSSYVINEDRNEASVLQNIGKKFTVTNCFSRAPQKPTDYIPVYDEQKKPFSGCDKFNQQLYGINFPYQAPNDTNLAE